MEAPSVVVRPAVAAGGSATIRISAADPDGDALAFEVVSPPLHGTLSAFVPADGDDAGETVVETLYTPDEGFVGADQLSVVATDGVNTTEPVAIAIEVNGPPTADAVTTTTARGAPVTVSLSGADPDGDALTFEIVAAPASGALGAVTSTGTVTAEVLYTPDADTRGPVTFSYRARDALDPSEPAVATVVVANEAPTVDEIAEQHVVAGGSVAIALHGQDVDGDPLTFEVVSAPDVGSVDDVTATGPASAELLYTAPYAGGQTTLSVVASDGVAVSSPLLVTVTIDGPPTASEASATLSEDGAVAVLLEGADPEGGALTFAVVDGPLHGALGDIAQGGSPATQAEVQYTPAPDFNGADTFTFSVTDVAGLTATATVTLTVEAVNDAPTFIPGADLTVESDGEAHVDAWASDIRAGPADEADQVVTFSVSVLENVALFAVPPAIDGDGTLSFTAHEGVRGVATVRVEATDGLTSSEPVTFLIAVVPPPTPPTAHAALVYVNEDEEAVITLTGTDPNEEDELTFLIWAEPDYGTLGPITHVDAADGTRSATVTYMPPPDFNSENGADDELVFWISDGVFPNVATFPSVSARVEIFVEPVNDAPTFVAGGDQTVVEDVGLVSVPWASNIDPGASNERAQAVSFVVEVIENAELFATPPTIDDEGTLRYAPVTNASGVATVRVRAIDDGGTANGGQDASEPTTFTITVEPLDDDPPVAEAGTALTDEDTPVTITLVGTDPDADTWGEGTALTFAIDTAPAHGSLGPITQVDALTAQVTYTPSQDYSGSDALTFTVDDGTTVSAPATVALGVRATNDRPTLTIDGVLVTQPGDPEPDEISVPILTSSTVDMGVRIDDAERLDGNNDARAPYYVRIAPIAWPTGPLREGDEPNWFEWKNFDINGFAKDAKILKPNFVTGNGGYIQFSSSVGVANEILNGLTFWMYYPGEYVIEIVVIDNGFLGRCPADLVTPDPDELEDFDTADYRRKIGREGDHLNGDEVRCIRETTTRVSFEHGSYLRSVRFVAEYSN